MLFQQLCFFRNLYIAFYFQNIYIILWCFNRNRAMSACYIHSIYLPAPILKTLFVFNFFLICNILLQIFLLPADPVWSCELTCAEGYVEDPSTGTTLCQCHPGRGTGGFQCPSMENCTIECLYGLRRDKVSKCYLILCLQKRKSKNNGELGREE